MTRRVAIVLAGALIVMLHSTAHAGGVTTLLSVGTSGNPANGGSFGPAISADGRSVPFVSGPSHLVPNDTNGVPDVFVHDRSTAITERVSVSSGGDQSNGYSSILTRPAVSGDGRYVAFVSGASNLVPDDTNGATDIFVHDRLTGITERVSID